MNPENVTDKNTITRLTTLTTTLTVLPTTVITTIGDINGTESVDPAVLTFYVIVVPLGTLIVVANILALGFLVFGKLLRNPAYHYVASLAMADAGVGLYLLVSNFTLVPYETFHKCLLHLCFMATICSVSIYSILAIAVDRYIFLVKAIYYYQRATFRHSIIIVLTTWAAGALIGFLPMMSRNNTSAESGECSVFNVIVPSYIMAMVTLFLLFPVVVIAVLYGRILHLAIEQRKKLLKQTHGFDTSGSRGSGPYSWRRISILRGLRAAKVVIAVVGVFLITWVPYFISVFVLILCKDSCPQSSTVSAYLSLLGCLNSLINPCIYACFGTEMKSERNVVKIIVHNCYCGYNGGTKIVFPDIRSQLDFQVKDEDLLENDWNLTFNLLFHLFVKPLILNNSYIMLDTGCRFSLRFYNRYRNMAPYIASYYQNYRKIPLKLSEMSYVYAAMVASQGLLMSLGGLLERRLGARWASVMGCVILSSGVTLTHFTVNMDFIYVIITYGVMFGVGISLSYISLISCGMKWFPEQRGLVSGIIVAGFGLGALIFNPIQTEFLNPENVLPNKQGYFYEESLLVRVPNIFLLLGGIYGAMQIVGCILASSPPVENKTENSTSETRESFLEKKEVGKVEVGTARNIYGQTFIHSDLFLAIVGSVGAVFNATGRIGWGVLVDRYKYKTCQRMLLIFALVVLLTMPATKLAGKYCFAVWMCCIHVAISGSFVIFPAFVSKLFGNEYSGVNYGLIFSHMFVGGPVSAILSTQLIGVIGFTGMFYMLAGFTILSLILTIPFREELYTVAKDKFAVRKAPLAINKLTKL
ncbi:hypothetical protein CHUAL_002510 [Chamberlinius hualienensis]